MYKLVRKILFQVTKTIALFKRAIAFLLARHLKM